MLGRNKVKIMIAIALSILMSGAIQVKKVQAVQTNPTQTQSRVNVINEQKDGWVKEGKDWYYYKNNVKQTGWYQYGNSKYYFNQNGVMQTGWLNLSGSKYYLLPEGDMVTGTRTIDGKTYTFSNTGVLIEKAKEGWIKEGEAWYYYKNNVKQTGWYQYGNSKYYFNQNGVMQTGWLNLSGSKYYLLPEGDMVTGTRTIDGKTYTFSNTGVLIEKVKEGWIKEGEAWYYYKNNVKQTGWYQYGNSKYYFNQNGVMQTGWLNLSGSKYYLLPEGDMVTGTRTIDGKTYTFSNTGVLIEKAKEGWIKEGEAWYYYKNNVKQTGWYQYGNSKYYFNQNGVMQTGFLNIGGKSYYLDQNGEMKTGWILVGEYNRYFHPNSGCMATNEVVDGWIVNEKGIKQIRVIEKIVYGKSGCNRDLTAYKIGNGSKVLVAVFEVHAYEDAWAKDGQELVNIANDLINNLQNRVKNGQGLNDWTVYVIPSANPDGLHEGWTNNGPGRTTPFNKVDINRSFPTNFRPYYDSRNNTGSTPLAAPEARYLKDFIQKVRTNASSPVVLDFHGWENKTIGDPQVARYFGNQFGFGHITSFPSGFIISWGNYIGAKSTLVELPYPSSHSDIINRGFSNKVSNAVINMLMGM